jgi:cathepsin L
VSVAVCATESWQGYASGVIKQTDCCEQLDHGVLAVGFQRSNSTHGGWIKVKNSWGSQWGENGYVRLEMSDQGAGTCGILSAASYPEA